MSTSCLALLLSLANSCLLPFSPVTVRLSLPPSGPDLCLHYADTAPVCVSQLIAGLEGRGRTGG